MTSKEKKAEIIAQYGKNPPGLFLQNLNAFFFRNLLLDSSHGTEHVIPPQAKKALVMGYSFLNCW